MGNITHEWVGTKLIVTSDSGTSACDLKGDKGDTGARGAQGAAGILDTTVLKDYIKTIKFTLNKNESVNIAFTDSATALITIRGKAIQVRAAYLYNGYGKGGADRAHMTTLDSGTAINYSALPVDDSGEINGITLSNASATYSGVVVITMLHGAEPTITKVTTTT